VGPWAQKLSHKNVLKISEKGAFSPQIGHFSKKRCSFFTRGHPEMGPWTGKNSQILKN